MNICLRHLPGKPVRRKKFNMIIIILKKTMEKFGSIK